MLLSYKQPQGELACLRWQEGVNASPNGLRLVRRERGFLPWESLVLPHEVDGGGHGFGVSDERRIPQTEVLHRHTWGQWGNITWILEAPQGVTEEGPALPRLLP